MVSILLLNTQHVLLNAQTVNAESFRSIEFNKKYHSHTYPILIFDAEFSSLLNKAFHNVDIAFASCNVQSSLLMERIAQTLNKIAAAVLANVI